MLQPLNLNQRVIAVMFFMSENLGFGLDEYCLFIGSFHMLIALTLMDVVPSLDITCKCPLITH